MLEREAWPLLRVDAAGPARASGAPRATRSSTASRRPSSPRRASIDASLRIQATDNANALAGVDPARLARAARARSAPLREVRLARRWAITLWPTAAAAQQAGMGTRELEEFVERALFLDRDDPVAAWGELRAFQAGLIERLAPAREIRIEAEGTDLTLDVEGRTWVNSDGKRNMPCGEVFTGPHETSAEGAIRFTIPTSPRGVVVEDVDARVPRGRASSTRAPSAATRTCRRRSRPTPAPAASASSASARTSASTARSARSCSTRRSAAPSTSRSAARIRRPAASTSPPCTGT